jgi:hypothetical protein
MQTIALSASYNAQKTVHGSYMVSHLLVTRLC